MPPKTINPPPNPLAAVLGSRGTGSPETPPRNPLARAVMPVVADDGSDDGDFPTEAFAPPLTATTEEISGIKLVVLNDPSQTLANSRAIQAAATAAEAQLSYLVKSNQFVPRDMVRQVCAEVFQSLAQALKAIPDHAERNGVSDKEMLNLISRSVDAGLLDAQDRLRGVFEAAGGEV